MGKLEYVELSVAVERLDMSERTIRRRIQEGALEGGKRGGKWWVQVPSDLPTLPTLPFATEEAVPSSVSDPVAVVREDPKPALIPQPATIPPPVTIQVPQPTISTQQSASATHRQGKTASSAKERTWSRGHPNYTPSSGDGLDQAFAVGRIGAWGKLRELRAVLTEPNDRIDGHAAAAMLLEGYLAYGNHKIDCYRNCRTILCRLVTRLEDDLADEDQFMAARDALGAVHALVVTMSRGSEDGKYSKKRDQANSGRNHSSDGRASN